MLADLVQLAVLIFDMLILARVVMSWVQVNPYSPIAQTIYNLTEPVLAPVRNLLGGATQGFDFSPMIVIIVVTAIGDLLARILS